ncbi:hypothetical protein F5X99DRAFT_399539, partial [Biscogniauxia marginata]
MGTSIACLLVYLILATLVNKLKSPYLSFCLCQIDLQAYHERSVSRVGRSSTLIGKNGNLEAVHLQLCNSKNNVDKKNDTGISRTT